MRNQGWRRGPFVLCAALGLWACGDDDASRDESGDAGSGGDAGAMVEGCDTVLEPASDSGMLDDGVDDTEALQTALIDAASGDVICLAAGYYRLTAELSLSEHRDVTLRGVGETRDDVVLDFADQDLGDDGIVVTADGFTIEHMWVKNTPGNGVVVKADDSVFRDLKVTWDTGSVTENGAYAVYPTTCMRTLVENVEVIGASDAGIYVGQCTGAIVRNNVVRGNVIGIEVENTHSADVYDNVIEDNTLGILAVILPNLMKKDGGEVLLRDNEIRQNNRENFAEAGTTAAAIPSGAGVLVLALPDVEVRDNTIEDQQGPGIFVASYEIFELLASAVSDDEETGKWPRRIYVHGNSFDEVGTAPAGDWALIGVIPLPPVIWDGVLAPDLETQADAEVCLGETEQMGFLKGNTGTVVGLFDPESQSDDVADHDCTPDPMPELSF